MNAAEIEAAQTFVFGDVRNRPCGFLWWVHSCSFLQQPPTQKGYVKESPSLEHTHTHTAANHEHGHWHSI